jgi:hypothetical protein
MKKFATAIGVVAINLVVLAALLGSIEFYFRKWGHEQQNPLSNGLWQTFQPFVMITTAPGDYTSFTNTFSNETYRSTVRTNSLGFNDRREFALTAPYKKAENERVVLFTGGSVAWGVGATATDRTVAGRMEYWLNSLQNRERYSVINLGMGSWIAFQQFIALQEWGTPFDPDWVVSMDGFNDAGVGCSYSQGPGRPMYFATMQSYIDGYLMSNLHPVFYRGWLENELIKYSAAYRDITGKQYIADNQMFDKGSNEDYSFRRQIIPTKLSESREMLGFYIQAEKGMLRLFPRAHYILSTQPSVNQLSGDFNDIYQHPDGSAEHKAAMENRMLGLEQYLDQHQNEMCGQKNSQPSFTYIFSGGAIKLEQLVDEETADGRRVEYYNAGALFPDGRPERIPYFIDTAHLTDDGMDRIGKFYAEKILAAENR